MNELSNHSIGTRNCCRHVVSVLMAILLGGLGGFGVFIVGLAAVATLPDAMSLDLRLLHLTQAQKQNALLISAIGSTAIPAIGYGFVTARSGRIVFGPRMKWIIRGILYGTSVTVAACFVGAFFGEPSTQFKWWTGPGPQFKWCIVGAEWVIRTTPVAALFGAVFGNVAYQISCSRKK